LKKAPLPERERGGVNVSLVNNVYFG